MAKTKLATCFISAPAKIDTSALREALESRAIRWTDAIAARPGFSIMDTIESAIQESDFVCVVLPASSENKNVLFEMGLACGLGRPLLLFAEEGAAIPSNLQGVASARTSLADRSAVDFHLDAFLGHAKKPSPKKSSRNTIKGERKVDVTWALSAVKEFNTRSPGSRGYEFERLVAKLFEMAGAVVSIHLGEKDIGADMAVWLDDLQPTIGNPLLVEVKIGRLTEDSIRRTEHQIQRYFPHVHARAGLVIYQDMDDKDLGPGSLTWPLVVRLSVRELIELVGNGQLSAEIIRRRNVAAHGSNLD